MSYSPHKEELKFHTGEEKIMAKRKNNLFKSKIFSFFIKWPIFAPAKRPRGATE